MKREALPPRCYSIIESFQECVGRQLSKHDTLGPRHKYRKSEVFYYRIESGVCDLLPGGSARKELYGFASLFMDGSYLWEPVSILWALKDLSEP